MTSRFAVLVLTILVAGCRSSFPVETSVGEGCEYARNFHILYSPADSCRIGGVVSVSPYDGSADTLIVDSPLERLVCMSTSGVAALSAIGADSSLIAVSGLRYVTDPDISARAEAASYRIYDIGYESSLDYEAILRLNPDVIIAYTVGESQPPYLTKLRSLGLRVLVVYDHMEQHPLARAEYVKLYGALTGNYDEALTFFAGVKERYDSLCVKEIRSPKKVLLNIPYADVWYVPGKDNYMSRLISDAGGMVVGAVPGTESGSITIEEAYKLSLEADVWLCPGHCITRKQLSAVHHLFPMFGPMKNDQPIYNNTRRSNAAGGNDFYESGSVRPDLILQDLRYIFSAVDKDAPPMAGACDCRYFIMLSD